MNPLATTQAARLIGCSENAVRKWANAGRLKCYRLPVGLKPRRFTRAAVERFIKEQRT